MSRFEQSMSKYKAWNNVTTLPLGAKAQTTAHSFGSKSFAVSGQGIFFMERSMQMDSDSRHRTMMDILAALNDVLHWHAFICMPA